MSVNRNGLRVATCVFEAAAWHLAVEVRCSCGHRALHDPHGLWWHCERRRWNDDFRALKPRFYCTRCLASLRRKVRPSRIAAAADRERTICLPLPPDREWKRALSRFRC